MPHARPLRPFLLPLALAIAIPASLTGCFELDPREETEQRSAAVSGRVRLETLGPSGQSVQRRALSASTSPDAVSGASEVDPTGPDTVPPEPVTGRDPPGMVWKAGEVLIAFAPHRFTPDTLQTALDGAFAAAARSAAGALDDARVRVRHCSGHRFCVADLYDGFGEHLDLQRTAFAARALNAHRPEGVAAIARNTKKSGFRVPNDAFAGFQWSHDFIHLGAAWDLQIGSDDVVIAVLDSGVVVDHPDLAGRLLPGADLLSHEDLDRDDEPGRDDDPSDPGDLLFDPESSFHGSHVAGVLGASTDNAEGIAGVTWAGGVLPVRVLGAQLDGFDDDIVTALLWAVGVPGIEGAADNENPARVVNMSLGGPTDEAGQELWSTVVATVITDPDEEIPVEEPILIAAAGNTGVDAGQAGIVPATTPGVISVGAARFDGRRASYSNFGAVDVLAPGGELDLDQNGDGDPDGILSLRGEAYDFDAGTSMAAPHVAGVAALIMAQEPALTGTQVAAIMLASANPDGQCDEGCGTGWLDAPAALLLAGAVLNPEPALQVDVADVFIGQGFQTAIVHVLNLGGAPFDFSATVAGAQEDLFTVEPAQGTVPPADDEETGGRLALTITLARGGFTAGDANLVIRGLGTASDQRAVVDLAFDDSRGGALPVVQSVVVSIFEVGEDGEREIGSTVARREAGFAFTLDELLPGTYRLRATADDGVSIGVYPSAAGVGAFTLAKGEKKDGVEIVARPTFVADPPGQVGSPCDGPEDCAFAPDADCIVTFNGGYCSRLCDDGRCGDGAACEVLDCDGEPCAVCLRECVSDSQCRFDDGYTCDGFGTCTPTALQTP
jgi:serine protease